MIRSHVYWLNDARLMRFSEQRRKMHNLDTQRAYIDSQTYFFHALNISTDLNPTVGSMSVYYDRSNRVADMGIMIGAEFCGEGYGSEAWYVVYDWLLANHVGKVEAGFMEGNRGMEGICRKRMLYEGRRARHFINDDHNGLDMILYGSHHNESRRHHRRENGFNAPAG